MFYCIVLAVAPEEIALRFSLKVPDTEYIVCTFAASAQKKMKAAARNPPSKRAGSAVELRPASKGRFAAHPQERRHSAAEGGTRDRERRAGVLHPAATPRHVSDGHSNGRKGELPVTRRRCDFGFKRRRAGPSGKTHKPGQRPDMVWCEAVRGVEHGLHGKSAGIWSCWSRCWKRRCTCAALFRSHQSKSIEGWKCCCNSAAPQAKALIVHCARHAHLPVPAPVPLTRSAVRDASGCY
jgi:hypothetical protein